MSNPRRSRKGMGGHQSAAAQTHVWLTPPEILAALGGAESFDLDPCSCCQPRPWPTARVHLTEADDGLRLPWPTRARVFLNPPYGRLIGAWMAKIAQHGRGTALTFARTETEWFCRSVWDAADAALFLEGRLHFHLPDGSRAENNAGAPSVLIAYGPEDTEILHDCGLPGRFVPISPPTALFMAVRSSPAGDISWRELVIAVIERQGGHIRLRDLYSLLAWHPKTHGNRHWREKVRQTVSSRANLVPIGKGEYRLPHV